MAVSAALPTLYEYYTTGGTSFSLSVDQPQFTLNNRNITIFSGAMHYFRVPKPYWRNRLRKMRAAGLNTVETYIPWNLHEPQNGVYDFGNGGSDMEEFLDVQDFLKTAQEEDLFAIVRPGPYICAEWEFGGFPSWLLKEENITLRSSESTYLNYVKRYFNILLPILALFQFTNGGPIIAFQVENEYAYAPYIDLKYLEELNELMIKNGIVELLVTSDGSSSGSSGTIPGLFFQTLNTGSNIEASLSILQEMQPNQPLMVMEFYPGWYDYWFGTHYQQSDEDFRNLYESILKFPSSVNLYMFHGGTSFGLLNGANAGNEGNSEFLPMTTSYDYNAPLNEAGDYTNKYYILKELIQKYNPVETLLPDQPEETIRAAYSSIAIEQKLDYPDIIAKISDVIENEAILSMEKLPINNNSGQSYGYIIYRKENINIEANSTLKIEGNLYDTLMVLIDNKLISNILTGVNDVNGFGFWKLNVSTLILTSESLFNVTLDLVVENLGRVNFGNMYHQYKGLEQNNITINGEVLSDWKHIPLEFKKSWNDQLDGWSDFQGEGENLGPALYKGTLTIDDPQDTFVDMREWSKGIVIVNGFVLGRFVLVGPQQSLYLPAPFLKTGNNDIIIFEQFIPAREIAFSNNSIFGTQ